MHADGLDQYVLDFPIHLLVLRNDTGVGGGLVVDGTGARAAPAGRSLSELDRGQLEDGTAEGLDHLLVV